MIANSYKFDAEACDVEDKASLLIFRNKRTQWLDWLNGEDQHAIVKQINLMSWDYAVFRTINESRRLAVGRKKPSAALNAMLAEFADTGFVAVQALAIRRLMEPAKRPTKQVVSLRRLVDDVIDHQHIFTRENYVGYDGCPFDPEPARTRWWEKTKRRIEEAGGAGCWSEDHLTRGPEAWEHSNYLHSRFDKMMRGHPTVHQRTDRLPSAIFDRLRDILKDQNIEATEIYCNKIIAHASDAASRSVHGELPSGLSFKELDASHMAIISAAAFVSDNLLNDAIGNPIAIPQYNLFDQLDATWTSKHDLEPLDMCWRLISEERNAWVRAAEAHILDGSAFDPPT